MLMVVLVMVIVLVAVLVVVMVMMRLHALHGFLALRAVAEHVHQTDGDHILIDGRFAGILHPGVGFAAHINQHVAGGELHDVLRRGLITVHIHAVPQEQRQFGILHLAAQNFLRPIVKWVNRRDDLQFLGLVLFLRCVRGLGTAAA